MRNMLEIGTVALAAENHVPDDLKQIKEALTLMEGAKDKGNFGEQADFAFHLAIVKATHNNMLINLMSSVVSLILQLKQCGKQDVSLSTLKKI